MKNKQIIWLRLLSGVSLNIKSRKSSRRDWRFQTCESCLSSSCLSSLRTCEWTSSWVRWGSKRRRIRRKRTKLCRRRCKLSLSALTSILSTTPRECATIATISTDVAGWQLSVLTKTDKITRRASANTVTSTTITEKRGTGRGKGRALCCWKARRQRKKRKILWSYPEVFRVPKD